MSTTVRKPRRRSAISSARVLDRRGRVWEGIIAVAGKLMAEGGIGAVSVEQILLGAGVSRGTFYSYCRSKNDLLVALIAPVFDEGTAALAPLAGAPPAEVVPRIIALYLDLWQHHRHALMLIPAIDPATFARLRPRHLAFTGAMKAALERAAAADGLRNGSAEYSFRVIARTAVPLLRVYDDHPDAAVLYRESLAALLLPPAVRRT
jgi:AcrR family transcriptional regulator